MKNILIVGCGAIGSKIYEEYKKLNPDRYDPYKGILEKRNIVYDIAFICVDTPMLENGECDLTQVEQAIQETNSNIIVLRSTVPPTTTDSLIQKTHKHIIFSPEFYGTTQHCDHATFNFNFTILGGPRADCDKVVQVLQEVYDARHRFIITEAKTAELAKYMENTFLAARVSLCIQFWEIANQFNISYPELREIFLNDERFNCAHTFVYSEHPWWESHCFDKDLKALVNFSNAPLVNDIINYNQQCRNKYKQEGDNNGTNNNKTWQPG